MARQVVTPQHNCPAGYLWAVDVYCVKAFFSYLLISLVLLQTFSREVLVADFTLHRATIMAHFCVNKARPQLHCNGQCYFAKKLKQQQERESKAPNSLKERLEMLPVALQSLVPLAPSHWANTPVGYAAYPAPPLPARAAYGVFHPPQA